MSLIRRLFIMVAVIGAGLGPGLAGSQSASPSLSELIASTVQLMTCDELRVSAGDIDLATLQQQGRTCWGGSGTVIRGDGLILTNAHVALDERQQEPLWVLVRQTVDARHLPQDAFFARAVLYSPAFRTGGFGSQETLLDLAILVPAYSLDGRPLQPGEVTMRPLPMGAPEALAFGDPIRNVGYPGIGGDKITVLQGAVSGWERDDGVPQLGENGWIKTDSTIAGGLSGGTTLSNAGELVGVPTRFGEADDRGGGMVGLINYLRPIPEGYDVLLAAGQGEGVPEPPGAATTDAEAVITGSVVAADTGQAVGGAWVIVLKPGVPVADFLDGNQEAVLSFATSRADGSFQLPEPVVRGERYGLLVIARGFVTSGQDNVVLAAADAPAVVTLAPIQLTIQR